MVLKLQQACVLTVQRLDTWIIRLNPGEQFNSNTLAENGFFDYVKHGFDTNTLVAVRTYSTNYNHIGSAIGEFICSLAKKLCMAVHHICPYLTLLHCQNLVASCLYRCIAVI